ncbi:MAG: sigma-70 family RNA polymerase sigma factor [Nannocystaceae bacterium]|nr:sigma-70 family RNA polymerase sigma factor [Nannocystaceae bacterium]
MQASWTPGSIAAALEGRGGGPDGLARTLLPLTIELAGRELYPWGSFYRRQPAELRNDVAQDVLLRLFANDGRVLLTWDPQLGLSLRSFVKRVIRYHVLQLFRTERGNPWRNEPTPVERLEQLDLEGPELLHQLWLWQVRDQLLERESSRSRDLYRALFVEQQSAEEVAREHDMTCDAVYQWRARFKQRAAKVLRQHESNAKEGSSS